MAVWSSLFFNCSHHWPLLVLHDRNGTATFMHIREGVTQGEALAMVAYGLGVLPLIKNLKIAYPDVTQPWYDDNAGALGKFVNIEVCFNSLTQLVTERSYYPDLIKIVLIFHPDNIEDGISFGVCDSFKF